MKKSFLLGAGFSYDFGMPLSKDLTKVFFSLFNEKNIQSLAQILASNNPYGTQRPISKEALIDGLQLLLKDKKNEEINYEKTLSEIQELAENYNKTQEEKDSYHYLFGIFYEIIHTLLSIYQEESFQLLYLRNKSCYSNFSKMLSDRETWIFSLNHDLFLEALALDFNIPITFGDQHDISFPLNNHEMNHKIKLTYSKRSELSGDNQKFYCEKFGINLVKLHGGLSELEYKDRSIICNQSMSKKSSFELMADYLMIQKMAYYHDGKMIPSGKDRVITNMDGELDIICKSMLTGGKKYSKTSNPKDGEEKLLIFDKVLVDIEELTIVGYGFGDRHINDRISNAMVLNPKLKIVIVDPTISRIPDFLEQFNYDMRIKKVHSGIAQWIEYCHSGQWNYEQMSILKENEQQRAIIQNRVEQRIKMFYSQTPQ